MGSISDQHLAPYKRLVLCSDGTWLSSNTGKHSAPSNVADIARAISPTGIDENGLLVKQIVMYHAGLGSGDLPLQQAIYGGLGWGLDNDVCQVYDFIANNWENGDEIFFFGFSRGAYTVRSVAGLLSDIGVLSAVQMDKFPDMWAAYRANTDGLPFQRTEWYLKNHSALGLKPAKIKVVGVYDTVGALGIPTWPVVQLAVEYGIPINKQYAFHNTKISSNIEYAFQALALDEKRLTFPPTLWHKTSDGPSKRLEQCWFPGVHSNIGGQADEVGSLGGRDEIGHNTFAWMVDNVSGLLTFEHSAIQRMIDRHTEAIGSIKIENGWGCGTLTNNFSGIQGAFFSLLGRRDRTPGSYTTDPGADFEGETNETFHPVVRIRLEKVRDWRPRSLSLFSQVEGDGRSGWKWTRKRGHPIPEYRLDPAKTVIVVDGPDVNGHMKFSKLKSLSRTMCPQRILEELDAADSM